MGKWRNGGLAIQGNAARLGDERGKAFGGVKSTPKLVNF